MQLQFIRGICHVATLEIQMKRFTFGWLAVSESPGICSLLIFQRASLISRNDFDIEHRLRVSLRLNINSPLGNSHGGMLKFFNLASNTCYFNFQVILPSETILILFKMKFQRIYCYFFTRQNEVSIKEQVTGIRQYCIEFERNLALRQIITKAPWNMEGRRK